ncbi:carbohydrate esterase family 4 protein [Schizophyllum amplum]|uniref:Carbohydrate esterase family 4 protein n=1 Tax=Schizophyllum amplum TaxID=97359 RepID=A0A550CIQ6_9AGAR|nr:carbohydrate esterase family 4 protein [Auriculariopsis ampla]
MFFSSLVPLVLAAVTVANPVKRQLAQVITNCANDNDAALTFDDGPWQYQTDIVNTLNDAGAKGTFFLNGNNYGCIYDQDLVDGLKYAYSQGHQLASHTWSHSDLTTLTWDQIHDEMWRVEEALQKIVGATPAFMRPPYGNYNDQVLSASYVRGQSVVYWSFDSGDSTGTPPDESNGMYDGLVGEHPGGIIALNHETYDTTAYQVLPHAIQDLQSAGYNLVTVAECMGMEPYQNFQDPGERDDSWTC